MQAASEDGSGLHTIWLPGPNLSSAARLGAFFLERAFFRQSATIGKDETPMPQANQQEPRLALTAGLFSADRSLQRCRVALLFAAGRLSKAWSRDPGSCRRPGIGKPVRTAGSPTTARDWPRPGG